MSLCKALSGHTKAVRSLSLMSSQYLVNGSIDQTVRVWDLSTYTQYKTFTSSNYVFVVDYFTDSMPISVDNNNQLVFWDMAYKSEPRLL